MKFRHCAYTLIEHRTNALLTSKGQMEQSLRVKGKLPSDCDSGGSWINIAKAGRSIVFYLEARKCGAAPSSAFLKYTLKHKELQRESDQNNS